VLTTLLVLFGVLGVLGWLSWSWSGTRDALRETAQQAVRIAELRGSIDRLDEALTMAARLAVATGEPRWIDRYEEEAPRLGGLIAEAIRLATPAVALRLVRTSEEASRRLAEMDHAAFALLAGGRAPEAGRLLDGADYTRLRAIRAEGLDAFGRDLVQIAEQHAEALTRRSELEFGGLLLGGALLLGVLLRGHARLVAALARTERVARTDSLTGLANRRRLIEVLDSPPAVAAQDGMAVLLLDLDRFKVVNDLHGHEAGDRLLTLVAARLRTIARATDLVVRRGGDEFAIVASLDRAGRPCDPQDVATDLARRVMDAMERPFSLGPDTLVQVGASIGIALHPQDGSRADVLLRCADVALYGAKAEGRGRFLFFEPGMDERLRERTALEADLRQAIAEGGIEPHFQPLVRLADRTQAGCEMLARWHHPVRGVVPPSVFVPLAEDVGLIGAMTEALLLRACREAMGWPAGMVLACNISPLQLRDRDLPAMVRRVLAETGLPPARLELELVESALVADYALARDLLAELKAIGVRLALDDFGTGYSSLRQLQSLPFDKLKIDGGFVRAVATDHESRKIVAAVIGLGRSLNLVTVAEGVEEEATFRLLRELGCDLGQGWLFGRPAPGAAPAGVEAVLRPPVGALPAA
jgi:diguanylate cyclase (GGDEF)-like protein